MMANLDARAGPKIFLNNKYISHLNFADSSGETSDPDISITSQNLATCISRRQIVNHLKSDKFEFKSHLQDNFQTPLVNHENTYVSMSDSLYQSLEKKELKKQKLPCPILVCNLLASHADTFRFDQNR